MTFEDVRDFSDEDLAKWLRNIWLAGFATHGLGGTKENCPNFYERLKEDK
nr:MAG TPA: Protein of unknown function (DUF3963) [Caudoviricetes sp.]